MRLAKLSTWLLLGGALILLRRKRRRTGGRRAEVALPPEDILPPHMRPDDLVQGFDETGEPYVEPIAVDVQTRDAAENTEDLAHLIADEDDEVPVDAVTLGTDLASSPEPYDDPRAARGGGDLYDVHVVDAEDKELPDDDHSFEEGEHWLEHLEASAGEYGAQPEHVLDVVDDSDEHSRTSHPTDTRDLPVADRGSAGPRGL